jgi:molybdate transport system substrate-binding protein
VVYTLLALYLAALLPAGQGMPAIKPITVSAAVSLTEALTAVAEAYGRTGGHVRFNFAASNVLARQIVNGAPVDVFISADEAQMDVVAAAGLVKDGSRVDVLRNLLAVALPNDRAHTFKNIKEIADPAFKRIAIGDPAGVPVGVYAKQYLEKEGLWDAVQARVVPTGSARAALAAVESGAADAAIVYRTDVRLSLHATVAWVMPIDRGPRILYPAAMIRTTTVPSESKRFLDFVRGDVATRIFQRFGFEIARPAAPTPRVALRRGKQAE